MSRNVGAGGDMPIFAWSVRWTLESVRHLHNPLFTTYLDHPQGANLMWNTTVLGPALLVTPVTILGGPILAFNVLATLGVVAPATAAYGALSLLAHRRLAAWLGGVLWGFGPWLLAQTRGDHLHLTLGATAIPLLALAAHEALVRQRRRPRTVGLILGAASALWLFVGEEALAIAAVTVGVAAAAMAAIERDWWSAGRERRLRHGAAVFGWALVAFVPLAAGPVAWQLAGPQRIHGSIFTNDSYDADLLAAVVPTGRQLITSAASSATALRFQSEEGGYLGIPVLIVAAVVVWRLRRRRALVALAMAAVALWVLSLGSHLHVNGRATGVALPWSLIRHLPLLDNLLPVRMTLGVSALVITVVTVGVDALLSTPTGRVGPSRLSTLGGLGAAACCALTLFPGVPFRSTELAVPAYFKSGAVRAVPQGAVAEIAPVARPERFSVQLWQAEAGLRFRMEGGYLLVPDASGHPSFAGPVSVTGANLVSIESTGAPIDTKMIDDIRRDLRERHVWLVAIGPMSHRDEVIELFQRTLAIPPTISGGVARWERVPSLLDRLRPST